MSAREVKQVRQAVHRVRTTCARYDSMPRSEQRFVAATLARDMDERVSAAVRVGLTAEVVDVLARELRAAPARGDALWTETLASAAAVLGTDTVTSVAVTSVREVTEPLACPSCGVAVRTPFPRCGRCGGALSPSAGTGVEMSRS